MVPLDNNGTLTKTTHNQKTEEQNILLLKSSEQSRSLAAPWTHNPILEFCVYFFLQILSPFQIFGSTHHCSLVHTICIFRSFRIFSGKKKGTKIALTRRSCHFRRVIYHLLHTVPGNWRLGGQCMGFQTDTGSLWTIPLWEVTDPCFLSNSLVLWVRTLSHSA